MVFRDVTTDGTIRLTGAIPQGGEAGPAGPPGAPGAAGPPGPPGSNYEGFFSFPTASTVWVISHGQNTQALSVETFNNSGERLLGDVVYQDNNTIRVEWYFPTSGTARLFD